MRGIAAIAAFSALGALCASCSFLPSEPYREVRSFDLAIPQAAGMPLRVQPFSADSACKFKLLYRAGGNEMLIDEYNKWTQPPAQLLTKHLRLAFRDEAPSAGKLPEPAKYELSGTVLAFEADLDAKRVDLGVRYSITPISSTTPNAQSIERTVIFSQPLKTNEPDAVAEAMAQAAGQLVDAVKSDCLALEAKQAVKAEGK